MRGTWSSRLVAMLVGIAIVDAACSDDSPDDGSTSSGGSSLGGEQAAGSAGAPGTAGAPAANSGGAPTVGNAGSGLGGAAGSRSAGAAGSASGGAAGSRSGGVGGSGSGTAGSASGGAAGSGAGGTMSNGKVTYSTNFDLTENPISEGGAWKPNAALWTPIATAGGIAFGTQKIGARPEADHYNDSYAYLTGFPADQRGTAVIYKQNVVAGCSHEVEILLRWDDAGGLARGYECNLAWDGGYAEIVRWEGTGKELTNFTYLAGPGGHGKNPNDGDVFLAEMIGNTINTYLNGQLLVSVTDTSVSGHAKFTQGQPGIGLYRGVTGCGALGDYGYKSFRADSVDP